MTEKHYCKNCKYLDHDGMFGIFCAVGGNNKNYDCPKYEEKGEGMSETITGINIIASNKLPVEFYNRKTKEREITHMMQTGDTIYVSEELFDGLKEKFEKGGDDGITDRFMVDNAGTLIDLETREMYDIVEEVCPVMNDLNNEKTRLYEDNIKIKQLITEAYNNERTQIGRNTLKQLLEQI